MPLNWNACKMKRRVWSEKKAHAGVTVVSGTELLTESYLKSEKKIKNLTNRRNRRRTEKKKKEVVRIWRIGRSKEKTSSEPT